jgi:hypothetical protein
MGVLATGNGNDISVATIKDLTDSFVVRPNMHGVPIRYNLPLTRKDGFATRRAGTVPLCHLSFVPFNLNLNLLLGRVQELLKFHLERKVKRTVLGVTVEPLRRMGGAALDAKIFA